MHIDWSENTRIKQATDERSVYYHEDHILIHAMHSWLRQPESSMVSISDDTDHGAAAIWASLYMKMHHCAMFRKTLQRETELVKIERTWKYSYKL